MIFSILVFSGCSQKCMQNDYECTPAEKGMMNLLKATTNTAEFINKAVPYKLK